MAAFSIWSGASSDNVVEEIGGFLTLIQANAFARAYVRDSLERCRAPGMSTKDVCGFANFGSLGILTGSLGVMVPERRAEVVALGLRSIVSGTLATLGSRAVAGVLYHL